MITVLRFDWEGTINFCNAEEKHFFLANAFYTLLNFK